MNAALNSPSGASRSGASLCPGCGGRIIKIGALVEVAYHVYFAESAQDLAVIAQELGVGEWSEESPAECSACGWRGEVKDLKLER